MGRQITIEMDDRDEREFLSFLRNSAEVVILTRHASTIEQLTMEHFSQDRSIVQFYLWNMAFAWKPSIGESTAGTPYIQDLSTAPVVEYFRKNGRRLGRLYWEKLPSQDGSYNSGYLTYRYDVEAFEAWYELMVKWIKKNSVAKGPRNQKRYYLKNAWRAGAWFSELFGRRFS